MIRLLIADSDVAFCRRVVEGARQAGDIDVVETVHDGEQALSAIRLHEPQALILELFLPVLDGLAVLERVGREQLRVRPKVIVTTVAAKEHLLGRALALGAEYCIIKPFHTPTLLERVRQLVYPEPVVRSGAGEHYEAIAREVARRLAELGVPPHFKGYQYLKDAVGIVARDLGMLNGVTKHLYPTIARRHGTSPERVERAIRNAIEVTMTRGNLDEIQRLFGYLLDAGKGKPSNSSFIARLANQVRLDLRVG
ncbi:MAG: sporulation transcription factor Spo0A [Firmicutes bacterium]|nr:sporulation transcription factor Spo0A [Bacillota bacterium]